MTSGLAFWFVSFQVPLGTAAFSLHHTKEPVVLPPLPSSVRHPPPPPPGTVPASGTPFAHEPQPKPGSLLVLDGYGNFFHLAVPGYTHCSLLQPLSLPAVHSFCHSLNSELLLWAKHLLSSHLQTHSSPGFLIPVNRTTHPEATASPPSSIFGYLCVFLTQTHEFREGGVETTQGLENILERKLFCLFPIVL